MSTILLKGRSSSTKNSSPHTVFLSFTGSDQLFDGGRFGGNARRPRLLDIQYDIHDNTSRQARWLVIVRCTISNIYIYILWT